MLQHPLRFILFTYERNPMEISFRQKEILLCCVVIYDMGQVAVPHRVI